MSETATLTYDPATRTTTVNGVRSPEPDGMAGVTATARLYAGLGYDVIIRRVRAGVPA